MVESREDIGALKCLWEETKDIVDDQDTGSGFWTSLVSLQTVDGSPLAFLFLGNSEPLYSD